MRKYFFQWQTFLLVTLFSLTIASCSKDSDDESKLTIDVEELSFSADGQSQTFRISSNTEWTITGTPNWLSVSPSAGSKNKSIVVTASENTSTNPRNCQLRIATDDGQAMQFISVVQEANAESLSIDVTEINLDGKLGSNGTLQITSNTSWTISGAPSWLTLSSATGNGNTQITVSANSDNASASPRECTLSITAGQAIRQVTIRQNGLLASNCTVAPKTIVTIADGFAFDFTFGSDVTYYYVRLYDPKRIERMTDAEIVEDIIKNGVRDTPNDQYVTSWEDLSPLTEYTACTVGFDKNGNHGELIKTVLKTKSSSNQALASISDVGYDTSYWYWTTKTNGFVTRYYQWYITNYNLFTTTDAAIAWFFNQAMKNNPDAFPAIAQGDDWHASRNGGTLFHVATWAVDVNGEFSGLIDRFAGIVDLSVKNVKKQKRSNDNSSMKRHLTRK